MEKTSLTARERFKSQFEKIIQNFDETPSLAGEIVKAKEEFFLLTGKLKDQDSDFSNRMNCFLLWFAFDWKSPSQNVTPAEYHLERLEKENQQTELAFLKQLSNHSHSLFNFIKQKQDAIIIQDVFTGKKIKVTDNTRTIGHIRDSLFESRLFIFEDESFFANYFIHHPVIVKKGILKRLKQIKKKKSDFKPFIHQLHRFHTKWTHYRNINIHSIYHFDNSVPEAK